MATGSEYVRLGLEALRGHRLRTALSVLGIAVGIAAVILLTSIGEGSRRYVLGEFTQFGTNVLAVNPGRTETVGLPMVFGGTTQKLTIDDAEILRRVAGVEHVVPLAWGMARVEAGALGRSVYVYGGTAEILPVWRYGVLQGDFLAPGDPRRGGPEVVLGPTLKRELFGERNAVGEFVRVAGSRLRVIGITAPKGQLLGFDLDDAAYVPVATAMQLFNMDELTEIDVSFHSQAAADDVVAGVKAALSERHGGREDFTVTTQAAMLEVFDKVLRVITLAVAGIAGISLLVGGIGILTMMWIAVGERTEEIGLEMALGATPAQVQRLFLTEAALLGAAGGVAGLAGGLGAAALLRAAVPGLPLHTPVGYIAAALAVSLGTGLAAGVLPARRGAALDPVEALRAE